MNVRHDKVTFTFDELKKLVKGKYVMTQCMECDGKGWYWVHEDGTKRNPTAGENVDDFYQHPCNDDIADECQGLGFFLKIED